MRIIEPSFEIEAIPDSVLERIEGAGRTCYKSENLITAGSAQKFVNKIMDIGHESVIEHIYISVRIICDRGVSHEIVRHRIASYSQESTRWCNYSKEKFGGHITFIKPCFFPSFPKFKNNTLTMKEANQFDWELFPDACLWISSMLRAEHNYFEAINEYKWKAQEARSILPNSLKTEIFCTLNLRSWRNFFQQRTSKKAHPQMQEIAIPMLQKFKNLIPIIFDDIHND
jgi:thymidylate synthase (FAD)